jgi:hypothetical protein
MKVIHRPPGPLWIGMNGAANLAYFYGCPLYLRIVPPVLTGTEPVRRPGIPPPDGSFSFGLLRGGPCGCIGWLTGP